MAALPLTVNGVDTRAPPARHQDADQYWPPGRWSRRSRPGLRPVLGVERVGVDDSSLRPRWGSDLPMQGGGAGPPRVDRAPADVSAEQSARLASAASFAGTPVWPTRAWVRWQATPITRWLHDLDGPVDQFNQTVVLQAPAGWAATMSRPCCRPCWTGTARCACRLTG